MANDQFLIADIGGTNIRMASCGDNPRERHHEVKYRADPRTGRPFTVNDALVDYLDKCSHGFKAACLGIAGRVNRDEVQITNRPDVVRAAEIADALSIDPARVLLVNDMPPHLASVDHLLRSELIVLKRGIGDPHGNRAVLMPGTGVGTGGAVHVHGFGHLPFPSEGGHVEFAPRDQEQDQLLAYLRPLAASVGMNVVSNEFVFAGEGIRRIYGFITGRSSDIPRSEDITTAAAAGGLPADDPSRKTIELYLRLLGAAAGGLAMMFAAIGGLYLGGSICLALRRYLDQPIFIDAFMNSGPPAHRDFFNEVPVYLIDYPDTGLLGSAVLAQKLGAIA